ncbi:MAG: ankyrin repeat domain-containing protein [Beijerinckiaceae bacterium]
MRLAIVLLAMLAAVPAMAQVPPTTAERAAYTGLFGVVATGWHNEIRQLLVNGLDPNARDGHGRTPYLVAAHNADAMAMEILIKGGADPRAMDSRRYDAITILAVANQPEVMLRAIDLGGDPRAITSPYEGTALIAAAHLGHWRVVDALIKAGAPLDHVNNLGWTALIEAIVLGDGGSNHLRCLELLLVAGADPNLADRNGTTPLRLAEGRAYAAMVAALVAKGAR